MDALNAPAVPVRKVKMKKPVKPASPTVNKVGGIFQVSIGVIPIIM